VIISGILQTMDSNIRETIRARRQIRMFRVKLREDANEAIGRLFGDRFPELAKKTPQWVNDWTVYLLDELAAQHDEKGEGPLSLDGLISAMGLIGRNFIEVGDGLDQSTYSSKVDDVNNDPAHPCNAEAKAHVTTMEAYTAALDSLKKCEEDSDAAGAGDITGGGFTGDFLNDLSVDEGTGSELPTVTPINCEAQQKAVNSLFTAKGATWDAYSNCMRANGQNPY